MIPQGEPGQIPDAEFLNAYSTPSQPGTTENPLIFDRNGASNGTAITHATNSANIVIQQPGFYSVAFSGTVTTPSGGRFPLSISLSLQQNGSSVPGAVSRSNFQAANQTANMAFSQIINVTSVPTTLTVNNSGGSILYDSISITVNKIGDA